MEFCPWSKVHEDLKFLLTESIFFINKINTQKRKEIEAKEILENKNNLEETKKKKLKKAQKKKKQSQHKFII